MIAIITDDIRNSWAIDSKEATALELKLNVTSKGHLWKAIGDDLFAIGTNKETAKTRVVVNTEQFEFLKMLHEREGGWESCRDL
jgi:hypothetical protein